MANYDYHYEMRQDVRNAIDEGYSLDEWRGRRDELESQLNDDLWIDDSVTGNASGSYYCNRYKAMEAVTDNMELLQEAADEFGADYDDIGCKFLNGDWEAFDVTIRCYLLSSIISEVLDDMEADGELDELEDEDAV
jgi:hypothetical protein